jgi:adenine deaminase
MEKTPVSIPAAVYEGLEAVRQSGYTNMLDRPRVIELAEMMGYDETAEWVRDHLSEYARLLFNGMVICEGEIECAD